MRRVAPLVPLTVGGNFDVSTADRYPALLDFLREQDFAPQIAQVLFKPVIRRASAGGARGVNLLMSGGQSATLLKSRCANSDGGSNAVCDSRYLADEQMAFLHVETRKRGFATVDGIHLGPCELYRHHSHAIGPDGSLYPCSGFAGNRARSVGHIRRTTSEHQAAFASQIARLEPWRKCGTCAFVPVCGGGCAVAALAELGDMTAPSCHKRALELALVNLAEDSAHSTEGG
jgi:uncharacterized protein